MVRLLLNVCIGFIGLALLSFSRCLLRRSLKFDTAEKVYGTTFEDLLQKAVLTPLNMTNSGYDAPSQYEQLDSQEIHFFHQVNIKSRIEFTSSATGVPASNDLPAHERQLHVHTTSSVRDGGRLLAGWLACRTAYLQYGPLQSMRQSVLLRPLPLHQLPLSLCSFELYH